MSERYYKKIKLNINSGIATQRKEESRFDIEASEMCSGNIDQVFTNACISAGLSGSISLKVEDGEEGELVITAVKTNIGNQYSEDYKNPPIPDGYEHFCGLWNDGFVIQRKSDKSQFVWVPVGYLDADGTIDGENYVDKFGRRKYNNTKYTGWTGYYEDSGIFQQLESVKKYGGFYISCFRMSCSQGFKIQSVKTASILTNITITDALKLANEFEDTLNVKSHLVYGSEYDSMQAWFFKSGEKPEVITDRFGRYNKRVRYTKHICFNADKYEDEWTNEKQGGSSSCIVRSGIYNREDLPRADVQYMLGYKKTSTTGFRVALWIK